MVTACDAGWGNFITAGFHQFRRRAADSGVPNQWADRDDLRPRASQSVSEVVNSQHRPQTGNRITWRNDDELGLPDRIQYRSRRSCLACPGIYDGSNLGPPLLAHKELLETE